MGFFKRLFGIKEKEEGQQPKPFIPEKKGRSTSIDEMMKSDQVITQKIVSGIDVEPAPEKKKEEIAVNKVGPASLGNPDPDTWSDFEKDGKYGYEDEDGNVMIEAMFDEADLFENGVATVQVKEKYGMIDPKGKYLLPPEYDYIYGITEGMVLLHKGPLMGYALPDGTIHIPLQYSMAREFSEGWAAVSDTENYGYIDKDNKTMLPFRYDDAGSFKDGMAYASIPDEEVGYSRYGFINKEGEFLIQPHYERAGDFREGIAPVQIGDKWAYINRKGEKLCEPTWHDANEFYQGRASVQLEKNGKWGFVDTNAKLVIDYQFDYGSDFMDEGTAYVFINKKCFTLYPDGKMKE